jgi:hypothetical protein
MILDIAALIVRDLNVEIFKGPESFIVGCKGPEH